MKTRILVVSLALLVTLSIASISSWAAHRSTAEEARAFFEAAVALVEDEGSAAALDVFNDRKGAFVRGDLYVFAVSLEGQYLASGANPKLAGTDFEAVIDSAGNPIYELMLEAVDNPDGEGSMEYEWLNRQTNQVETKHSFVRKLDDLYLGVGYYR